MRNYMDISSMFGKSSYNSSFNLNDYSLIKSGSYKKLMKAYYAKPEASKDKTTNSNNTVVNKLSESTDKTGLTKMKAEADSLNKSAAELTSENLWKADTKKEDVVNAVKDFANSYNNVVDQSSKVKSNDISNNMRWMTSMSNTMSKALGSIGITVGADNKLSVDEEKLGSADMKAVKSMFEGERSYGGQIEAKARNMTNAVNMTGIYNNQASMTNALQSMFSVGI